MDPPWPHGGRSTVNLMRICLLLGIASCNPHPFSFSASGPFCLLLGPTTLGRPARAHSGRSSQSGLSCRSSVSLIWRFSPATRTMPGSGLV
ncbi:hypothetical protein BDV25DRAFT_167673 [Aspergillus avenaceus]|uniref:Secreted protein n=1 Tax=Aspergillus avenaceus TaxID=36643 RepID=A0A5N6TCI3_ASPAV|nr:hypothetical protein BDV25DRAFT_167673 [Aspergillus avenaceus]